MYNNPHKTASASATSVVISYRDSNKHQWVSYDKQAITKDLQINGTARYQGVQKSVFNTLQLKLYNEALKGLSIYTEQELAKMPVQTQQKILTTYEKAQVILSNWKQSIVNARVDNLMMSLFPKSSITKAFTETRGFDPNIRNTDSFKSLRITKEMIAQKLVESGILPGNFYQMA